MSQVQYVPLSPIDPHRFESVLSAEQYTALLHLIEDGARELRERVVWNVNSTARGGGVVELLKPLLGYSRGAGVDARWAVIHADAPFFTLTKRLHNHLHGFKGDGGPLGARQRLHYEHVLSRCSAELAPLIRPADVVILHDPQTAGMVEAIRRTGATVIWRCHVGRDHRNQYAYEAWEFLRDYVLEADAFVFSRDAFAWPGLPADRVAVIHPSIDAFSPKNQHQTREQTLAILSASRLIPDDATHGSFVSSDGTPGRVDRHAIMVQERPVPEDATVVAQISRWDRLKDPVGLLRAFAAHVYGTTDAHLILAGPSTVAVADDPEGAEVLDSVVSAWHHLPADVRGHVHLASLPMDDVEENAAIVNALQRRADVIVQKSLAEGFGLTVAEAMWKSRPVVASAIGGIRDQIVDGESGVLLRHPRDPAECGAAIVRLLLDPPHAAQIGQAAHIRVRDHFLGPYHLQSYFELIQRLVRQPA